MEAQDLQFNGEVSLIGDGEFRGFVYGLLAPEPGKPQRALLTVSAPGATGLRSGAIRQFEVALLEPKYAVLKRVAGSPAPGQNERDAAALVDMIPDVAEVISTAEDPNAGVASLVARFSPSAQFQIEAPREKQPEEQAGAPGAVLDSADRLVYEDEGEEEEDGDLELED